MERARIVLASAGCPPVQQIAEAVGVSRPTVWRWQHRYAEAGVEGLLRDRTRKPGKAVFRARFLAGRVARLTRLESRCGVTAFVLHAHLHMQARTS